MNMKSARKRRVKLTEATPVHNLGTGNIGVTKSAKKTAGPCHKVIGRSSDFSVETNENVSPSSAAVRCKQLPEDATCLLVTTEKAPILDIYSKQVLYPTAKIRLQLFPINESTRMGLEKDGLHPYLELTLSTKKKISSVIKRLNSKWGGSRVAVGELVLFPYNTVEDMASYRWKMSDNRISAGDVFAAVGNPAVFRLRYGWLADSEVNISRLPSVSSLGEHPLKTKCTQKDCNIVVENTHHEVKESKAREEFKAPNLDWGTNEPFVEKISSSIAADPVDNEVRVDSGVTQPIVLWTDSMTNISIGGLLSEASLQGKVDSFTTKSNGASACLQPSPLVSDSFDAFLAGQLNYSEAPTVPPHESRSSILDAEDTCQAFSFQKFSSSENDGLCSRGSANLNSSSKKTGTKSYKFPKSNEANHPLADACQETETDLLLCSRVYNDESSLGLSGIKWTDSLGPFDLGISTSRKIIG